MVLGRSLRERQGEEAVDTRKRKGKGFLRQGSHWLYSVQGERDLSRWEDGNQTQSSCWCRVTCLLTGEHTLGPASLHPDAQAMKMKSGQQVESLGAKRRCWRKLWDGFSSECRGDIARDTCSSGVPLFPVSKGANSSQAAFHRNWVILLTKIASAWRSMSRRAQRPLIHRSQPEIFLSRDKNLYNKQEIEAQLCKWKKNVKEVPFPCL